VTAAEEHADDLERIAHSMATSPRPRSSSQLPGSDQRAYVRLAKKVNVRYKVFKSQDELLTRGFTSEQFSVTKNISAGGVLFISDEPAPIGSTVELKIELPIGEAPIECFGRVVRIDEIEPQKAYNVAVCFLDLTSADRAKLDKYVEEELV
jgi:c-di-GMP-binding flagellar brake protein YcgR